MKGKLIIFDFDGTLADTFDMYIDIARQTPWIHTFLPETADSIKTSGLDHILRSANINPFKMLVLLFLMRMRVAKSIIKAPIHKDSYLVLKQLSKHNTIGIISSNSTGNINRFLKRHGIQPYVSFVMSSLFYTKKHIKIAKAYKEYKVQKNDVYYIGDESRDVKAAHKAGVNSIAVSWGFEDRSLLRKVRPDYLVDTTTQLLKIFI